MACWPGSCWSWVCSFVMAMCVCLAPCVGMCMLSPGKEQSSACYGDTCVIKGPVGGMRRSSVASDSETQTSWCHTREGVYCLDESGPRVPLSYAKEMAFSFSQFYGCGMEAPWSQPEAGKQG